MDRLFEHLTDVAQGGFSGAVRVQHNGETVVEFAAGMADRANQRANTTGTRFAVASVTKGLTALTIMSLIESGDLTLDTTLASVVSDQLPGADADVTIEQLLTHRSGVGDYIDEDVLDDIDENLLGQSPAHTLQVPSDYLALLHAHGQKTAPGATFAYNNSGFVILSYVVQVLTGSFHDSVHERVLLPAGMTGGGFLRSDCLPGDTALGYLQDGRTNVLHLPVVGAGDGGAYLTLDDSTSLWHAFTSGAIVSAESVALMTEVVTKRGDKPSYGRGLWLDATGDHVWLEGMDAGVSAQTGIVRSTGVTYAVLANDSSGAWGMAEAIVASAMETA